MPPKVMHTFILLVTLQVTSCKTSAPIDEGSRTRSYGAEAKPMQVSDPRATTATKTLFANLASLRGALGSDGKRNMPLVLGQQEYDVSNRKSSGVKAVPSDVRQVADQRPAMVSYEIGHAYKGALTFFDTTGLEQGLDDLRTVITENHRRGVVVSLVWHIRCPKSSPGEADKYRPSECPSQYNLTELLARRPADGQPGALHREWVLMLDILGKYLNTLVDDAGQPIPVLIRPFHEFTGDWFWWGRSNNPDVFIQAWQEMVRYLRDTHGVHNALWVFCPDKPTDKYQTENGGQFELYYPGDDYVDIIAFDRYDFNDGKFAAGYLADIVSVGAFASAHGKIAGVGEVGIRLDQYGSRAAAQWFSKSMLEPLVTTESGALFSFAALWRNAPWEKYIPEHDDDEAAADFRKMCSDPLVLMQNKGNLYKAAP